MMGNPKEYAQSPKDEALLTKSPCETNDPLSPILGIVRLKGGHAVFSEGDSSYALQFPAGVPCLHIVEFGSLRLSGAAGEPPVELRRGDVVLSAHGLGHTLSCATGHLGADVQTEAAQSYDPVRRCIGAGGNVRVLTGSFSLDPVLAKHLLAVIPPIVVIPAQDGRLAPKLLRIFDMIAEELLDSENTSQAILERQLEMLFMQTLRSLIHQGDGKASWLSACSDPRLRRVLTEVHRAPERPWTLPQLSQLAGMSRSSFANHFLDNVGYTPMAYVACWRLDRACVLLAESANPVAEVALATGYSSAASFTRAFKERFKQSPKVWRTENC